MREELQERFGASVTVEYLDIYSVEASQHPDTMRVLSRGDIPLPIISIDGKPRFAGGISGQVVGDALEKMGLAAIAV
jgi:hypothetical protein